MKSGFMKAVCRLLIVSLMLLPFQSVQAGMLGSGQVAASASAQGEREALMSLVGRTDVARQLQTMGLDPAAAKQRVAAMTDSEVSALTGQINSLPAGANSNGWAWAVVILIGVVIWYNWKR